MCWTRERTDHLVLQSLQELVMILTVPLIDSGSGSHLTFIIGVSPSARTLRSLSALVAEVMQRILTKRKVTVYDWTLVFQCIFADGS